MGHTHRLVILAALLLTAAIAQQPFKVGIALDSPPQLIGNCNPTRVHFSGRINATTPGVASYQWIRSHNSTSPVQTLRFVKPGPVTVSYDWMLRKSYSGWVALKVLSPNPIESGKVSFRLDCGR